MKLTDAIKKYFGRYEEADEYEESDESEGIKKPVYKKKKKKKKIPAGSYFKKKRDKYEKLLKEADEY